MEVRVQKVELVLKNIGQLVTCAGSEKALRGAEMSAVNMLENGAVAVAEGKIVAVGDSAVVLGAYSADSVIDCEGKAVVPGFVDSHTHTVFGGDRVHEFEMRIQGADYLEIMAAGGGIVSTMKHTREASEESLVESARKRLDQMLALGSTTVEIKTGYGLDTATELKMLRVVETLDKEHPCSLIPTFLGAHTLPPEYKSDPAGYVDLVVDEMIPAVAEWYRQSHFPAAGVPIFIDVFTEDHAFDVAQSKRILEAGQRAGMQAKIHVDQFNAFGGTQMAVELGAVSADHLDVSGPAEIEALANSGTICVPLPAANFNLGHDIAAYPNGRAMIDAGCALALATDLNPGSAPCYSMPLVMAISNRVLRLTPAETLVASTINGAHALMLANRVGSIEVGKAADLLILKAADWRHLSYFLGGNPVETVIKNGEVVM
ncbi:MAG: imidazolonepropionase [Cellvibrionaceae bacterium]|jgi:imidazolonepropionase